MILAGFALLLIGAVDLIRQFVPRRHWIGFAVVGVLAVALGALSGSVLPALAGVALAAAWIWLMPAGRVARASFWPAAALAALTVAAVAWSPARSEAGVIGGVWQLSWAGGAVSFDEAVLVVGVLAFLLESGNVVVRAALDAEHVVIARPAGRSRGSAAESAPERPAAVEQPAAEGPAPAAGPSGFRGGRLIGPLERVLVFLLTLATAYPLLAAVLAAKGIVRFPEISRDGESGERAEYFLVGSLASWVIAVVAAFLVWWAVLG